MPIVFLVFRILYTTFSNAILFLDCAFNSITMKNEKKKRLKRFYSIEHFNQINIYRHSLFTACTHTHARSHMHTSHTNQKSKIKKLIPNRGMWCVSTFSNVCYKIECGKICPEKILL